MHGLDQAIRSPGDRLQPVAQGAQALAMQRVDADRVAAQRRLQPAAGFDRDVVNGLVLHIDRVVRVLPVVVETWLGIDLLVDVAAQGHVDLLHAAAHAEDRQATGDGQLHQRDVEQVALLVLGLARGLVLLAVQRRVDVAARAGQVDAVGHVEVGLQVVGAAAGRHQYRHTAREVDQRGDVLVGHDLIVVAFALLRTHGHQDDRFAQGLSLLANVAVGHKSPWDRGCPAVVVQAGETHVPCLKSRALPAGRTYGDGPVGTRSQLARAVRDVKRANERCRRPSSV